MKIGIVGCGFVGGAIAKGFSLYHDVRAFDLDKTRATHSMEETVTSDIVFVCLPTPMKSVTGGDCNLSIINKFFEDIEAYDVSETVFVIKSTVPVGTTQRLTKEHPTLKIVHSPEFLTARTANIDFITPSRNIVGGYDKDAIKKVKDLFESRFQGVPCLAMTAKESEMVKYMCNCFYFTKIMFFNEMRLLADKMSLNWDNLIQGMLSSGWISHMHTDVPGHDGQRGVGGTCFPKDINAMMSVMKEHDIDPKVLSAVWEQNLAIREDWDWERFASAVLKDEEN